uniref:Uncharacterized protein n=1 Tax=Cyanothece sp. (strain PCC 7425 / ATCC 29141) TaxID=395961 RepID=B8HXH7_CYAP4
MSIENYQILVNDLGIPLVQRLLMSYWLKTTVGHPFQLIWGSELGLSTPPTWQVKPEVGLPLALKLWSLENICRDTIIYLDGNTIPQADLTAAVQPEAWLQMPERVALKQLIFFVVKHELAAPEHEFSYAVKEIRASYTQAADYDQYDPTLMPSEWMPVAYNLNPKANLISCVALQERPWYNPCAPATALWITYLNQSIQQGFISIDTIAEDIEQQRIHPGILELLESRINPIDQPLFLSSPSRFESPEIKISPAQQQMIASTIYEMPKRSFWRSLASGYVTEVMLPRELKNFSKKWRVFQQDYRIRARKARYVLKIILPKRLNRALRDDKKD